MILDASATPCLSPQVQTSLEEYWDLFHPVPALNGVTPVMPFDAAHLILDATYNALGNEDLLRLVDLETKTKAHCRTGNTTETDVLVDRVLEVEREASGGGAIGDFERSLHHNVCAVVVNLAADVASTIRLGCFGLQCGCFGSGCFGFRARGREKTATHLLPPGSRGQACDADAILSLIHI